MRLLVIGLGDVPPIYRDGFSNKYLDLDQVVSITAGQLGRQ